MRQNKKNANEGTHVWTRNKATNQWKFIAFVARVGHWTEQKCDAKETVLKKSNMTRKPDMLQIHGPTRF